MCYNNMYSLLFFLLICFLVSETTPFSITITIDPDQNKTVKQVEKSLNETKNSSLSACGPYKMPDFSSVAQLISEQKCLEYVYQMLKRQERNLLGCSDVSIIHGKTTKAAEYPHMGALGWLNYVTGEFDFLCGASLISEMFMLTAAHCTINSRNRKLSKRPTIVKLGTRYLKDSPWETAEDIGILNLISHPDYNPKHRYYDIALVELERAVIFSKFIQPACLSTREYDLSSSTRLTVTGWGQNAPKRNKNSNQLLYADIHIYPENECNKFLNKYNLYMLSHQMCAGDKDGVKDTCQGDSGGPLTYELANTTIEGTIHKVLSVTSFGLTACATMNAPGIYTKVSDFIGWIECNVWKKGNRWC